MHMQIYAYLFHQAAKSPAANLISLESKNTFFIVFNKFFCFLVLACPGNWALLTMRNSKRNHAIHSNQMVDFFC